MGLPNDEKQQCYVSLSVRRILWRHWSCEFACLGERGVSGLKADKNGFDLTSKKENWEGIDKQEPALAFSPQPDRGFKVLPCSKSQERLCRECPSGTGWPPKKVKNESPGDSTSHENHLLVDSGDLLGRRLGALGDSFLTFWAEKDFDDSARPGDLIFFWSFLRAFSFQFSLWVPGAVVGAFSCHSGSGARNLSCEAVWMELRQLRSDAFRESFFRSHSLKQRKIPLYGVSCFTKTCGLVCGSPCGSPMWGANFAMAC